MRLPHLELNIEEQLRLQALREYKILDSGPEPAYEDIIHLAAMICETPISIITLVDQDRQWFKAKQGLDFAETPRESSFCAHVVQMKKSLIVGDALKEEKFKNFSFVSQAPHLRFYAGVPLITPAGFAVGALCVKDTRPRTLSTGQLAALETLARQVMSQMELRKTNLKYQEAYEKIDEQQTKLVHSAKLASIGEMAASIAHEINNPLTIINGNVGLLRRVIGSPKADLEKGNLYLDSIEKTVHRIDKIIRGLKALSRDGSADPFEEIDLRQSIENAISLVREKFKSRGIELKEKYLDQKMMIECRAVQIEQILINLLSNTFDAIRDQKEKWVEIQILDADTSWMISITDSGSGIPKPHQDKIMMPFFTTKQLNQGTGLGLSISKGIAEEHNGSLELDRMSVHTRFVIHLPKKQKPQKTGA